jgi:general stress protein YciG
MTFENEPNESLSTVDTAADNMPPAPVPTSSTEQDRPRKRRGFAAMDKALVSELATRGGKAAHRAGTAHEFTSEEARVAGRKGGLATHAKRRAQSSGPRMA